MGSRHQRTLVVVVVGLVAASASARAAAQPATTGSAQPAAAGSAPVGPADEAVPSSPSGGPGRWSERAIEGAYGGLGVTGLFGVGSQGTELDTNCDTLGAASCNTAAPWGGGLFGYVGWTWNPVGFEMLVGASFDNSRQSATFDGQGASGNLPLAMPAREETFHFYRAGGIAALRVRAVFPLSPVLRATVAGGLGASYKQMFMLRRAVAADGGGQNSYAPDSVAYWSPAITVEAALHVRLTPTVAVALGALMWADNASIAGNNASPPEAPRTLVDANHLPQSIPTPQYHFASGPQVFLGPFIGLQFGP